MLNDPAQMASLMPGVQSFEVHDDKRWSAKVRGAARPRVGLALSFDFEKTEERELELSEKLQAKGNGVGAMIGMETQFTLEPVDGSHARMLWAADLSVAGPVGSMGQRVLPPDREAAGQPGARRAREGVEAHRRSSRPSPRSPWRRRFASA